MPKVTITIDLIGGTDMEMQRPVGEILKAHSTALLSRGMKPEGCIEFDYYKAVLKWKVERGE